MAKKQKANKSKRLSYLIAALALIIVVVTGSMVAVSIINDTNNNQTIAEADKQAADQLFDLANREWQAQKYSSAKALFEAARKQYLYIMENSSDEVVVGEATNAEMRCRSNIAQIEADDNK